MEMLNKEGMKSGKERVYGNEEEQNIGWLDDLPD